MSHYLVSWASLHTNMATRAALLSQAHRHHPSLCFPLGLIMPVYTLWSIRSDLSLSWHLQSLSFPLATWLLDFVGIFFVIDSWFWILVTVWLSCVCLNPALSLQSVVLFALCSVPDFFSLFFKCFLYFWTIPNFLWLFMINDLHLHFTCKAFPFNPSSVQAGSVPK